MKLDWEENQPLPHMWKGTKPATGMFNLLGGMQEETAK